MVPRGLGSDIFPDALDIDGSSGIFTQNKGPGGAFRSARVKEVLWQVKLGSQLSEEEYACATALIWEYADCLALSVSEVCHVPGAVHKLSVPENASVRI
ncbi:hypothetical protein BDP27DRAFT_1233963 [Rhodocollybia butyracea]|uniref:Uncharacterized protein n=1 Tax=Rhodocollybia butyracea TaxID=206335 RepID=A0A9P5PFF7_9AGAR|nr:hypothetical protein BDP27DRAFT_1233963 [Rhodocollybia butyracea]